MKRKQIARWMALGLALMLLAGCAADDSRGRTDDASTTEKSVAAQAASTTEADKADTAETADTADTGDTEEAAQEPEYFPAVGEQMQGFTLNEVRAFPLIGAEIGLFEHDKTGAKVIYLHNDDTNRAFDLTFLTRASDNTGIPHVFEHATLDGSKKYPSKELFFNLNYQTYQTYMNAMTAENMTTYPIASLSEAQLLKLADYYIDSCFNPMIMEDESIYREEAWRYRLADKDDDLTLEGTVYTEMSGAMDKSVWATYNALRASMPGSYMNYVEGGDPAFIPDMTFESLCDFHDRYYHPSNCVAYLYGDIEDYAAFLELLDTEFSKYEKKEFVFEDEGYEAITEAVTEEVAFAAEEGTSTDDAAVVYYTIVCGDLEEEELIAMSYLMSVFSESASDLYQKIQQKLPTGTFKAGFEMTGTETLAMFAVENVAREDAETFKKLVDEAIADVAENGFPEDLVDGLMARTQLENKIIREGQNIGVGFIVQIAYAYAKTGNPWYLQDAFEAASEMQNWNGDGTFAKLAEQYLKDSETTTLVTTYPEPGLKEKQDAELAEKLAKVKASMSEEELEAIVAQTQEADAEKEEADADTEEQDAADGASTAATEASTAATEASTAASEASTEEEKEETPADDKTEDYVKQLTAVTVDELPEEVRVYEVTDETGENGVRYLNAEAAVDGVGYTQVLLDASGVEEDALHDLALFVALTGYLDTKEHTRGEIETLSTRYFYNPAVALGPEEDEEGNTTLYLALGWIANEDDLEAGYDLMYETIYDLKLDDTQKLKESVASIRSDLKAAINASPFSYQVIRGMAYFNEQALYQEYLGGLQYYAYLEETEAELADKKEAEEVVARLQAVQEQMRNGTNAIALFAGDKSSIKTNETQVNAFLEKLGFEEIKPAKHDLVKPEKSEGFIVESNVQYNSLFADYETLGLEEFEGSLDVASNVVSDMFLYPMLRDRYGAYSVMHQFMEDVGCYVVTYRDPNVTETFDVYGQLPDLLRDLEIDQEKIDGYIMSSYAMYAMPMGELSGALSALSNLYEGEEQGEKAIRYMQQIKETTPETIKAYADAYAKLFEDGVRATSGGAAAIMEHEEFYDAIYNPFGAEAVETAEGFSDVPEDHPLHDSVMKAYEYGLMLPLDEETFGVDDDGSVGDLAYAFASMMGGAESGEAALETMQQFKVFPDRFKADDPLKRSTLLEIMNTMAAMGGGSVDDAEFDDYIAGDTVTRGELARILTEE